MAEHSFCRQMLKTTMEQVRQVTTPEQRKAAWAYMVSIGQKQGEFHGPNGFYWYQGQCCCWYTKAEGWAAWLAWMGYIDEDGEFDPSRKPLHG